MTSIQPQLLWKSENLHCALALQEEAEASKRRSEAAGSGAGASGSGELAAALVVSFNRFVRMRTMPCLQGTLPRRQAVLPGVVTPLDLCCATTHPCAAAGRASGIVAKSAKKTRFTEPEKEVEPAAAAQQAAAPAAATEEAPGTACKRRR